MLWFTKAKRAQTDNDFETWNSGGVVPTLNRMDNNGESRATVLIIDGTRVNDVRVYDDEIAPTVISRYGTGGGNVPAVMPTILAGLSQLTGTTQDGYITKVAETTQTVRRLTPVECERLQGFPDNWTADQADSNRYKQMGNAVAVPVVQWIVGRMTNANL